MFFGRSDFTAHLKGLNEFLNRDVDKFLGFEFHRPPRHSWRLKELRYVLLDTSVNVKTDFEKYI